MRRTYNDISEGVKRKGGQVYIFSSQHASGEKLNNLTGIAAILRFPLNLDYLDEEEEKLQEELEKKE
jgi:protein pelota